MCNNGNTAFFCGNGGGNAHVTALAEHEVGLFVVDNFARVFTAFDKFERQSQITENFSAHEFWRVVFPERNAAVFTNIFFNPACAEINGVKNTIFFIYLIYL